MEDIIDQRNRKEQSAHSIIKRWNVHYTTQEEMEYQKQEEERREAQKIIDRLGAEAAADEAQKQADIEAIREKLLNEELHNTSTNSYSGIYGHEQLTDEVTNTQIEQILKERENEFQQILEKVKEDTLK